MPCSLAKTAATGASLREVTTAAVKRCRAFFVNSLSLSVSLSLSLSLSLYYSLLSCHRERLVDSIVSLVSTGEW